MIRAQLIAYSAGLGVEQPFSRECESTVGVSRIAKLAAGEIARAAAFAVEFFEDMFEKRIHIFARRRMLGEEQVALFFRRQESNRFL